MCFSEIEGASQSAVESAFNRIDLMLDTAREKHPCTHFLSIPVTSRHIQKQFLQFQEDVLGRFGEVGINCDFFTFIVGLCI